MYKRYAPSQLIQRNAGKNRRTRLFKAPRRVATYKTPPPIRSTAEVKGVDTPLTIALGSVLATTNTNGAIIPVNLVTSGNGPQNRIGRKITMKSLRVRGVARYFYAPDVTSGNIDANSLRMIVVYDAQPSGVLPTFDTIFGRTVQDGTESTQYQDSLRYDNTDRFKVLRDVITKCDPNLFNSAGGTTDAVTEEYLFDEFIPLKGLPVQFSGQTDPTTIADLSTGGLYVIFCASYNLTDFNAWVISSISFARFRYTDV